MFGESLGSVTVKNQNVVLVFECFKKLLEFV